MSHTARYSGPPTDKESTAMDDIKFWLGDKFEEKEAFLKAEPMSGDLFTLCCGFLGVQGYPVGVWYKRLYGKEMS